MNNKVIIAIFAVAIIVIIIFALNLNLSNYSPAVQSDKIPVAASFYPIYFFAQQIGGEKAEVFNITPAGAEPHDYELTPQDLSRIKNSRMLIINGFFEPWVGKIEWNIDPENTLVLNLTDDLINRETENIGPKTTIIFDPHIWLSYKLANGMIDKILQGFINVDPQNQDYYFANAEYLRQKLYELDEKYKSSLANCKNKNIVTSHAAFSRLAKEYGLNQISITGISPDEEPSPQRLAEISQFVKDNKISYIFFESLLSPKLSETIAAETGAKTLMLDPIEGLLDEQIEKGENYFTVMKKNLSNLKLALQCPIQ